MRWFKIRLKEIWYIFCLKAFFSEIFPSKFSSSLCRHIQHTLPAVRSIALSSKAFDWRKQSKKSSFKFIFTLKRLHRLSKGSSEGLKRSWIFFRWCSAIYDTRERIYISMPYDSQKQICRRLLKGFLSYLLEKREKWDKKGFTSLSCFSSTTQQAIWNDDIRQWNWDSHLSTIVWRCVFCP